TRALTIEWRPAMGRYIHSVDLIGVVCQELSQSTKEVAVLFFLEPDDVGDLRQNVVRTEQSDRFAVYCGSGAFANPRLGVGIGCLDTHENARETRLLVKMQNGAVPNDVAGANGGDQLD